VNHHDPRSERDGAGPQSSYEIRVQGWLAERWDGWFGVITVTRATDLDGTRITTLAGRVADQAVLRGILSEIWNLNLSPISVARIEAGPDA
jgi:hypothetical protein